MIKKLSAGEFKEQEMTEDLAFKYLKEFAEKNNLQDDSSILIVKSVDFIEKHYIKVKNFEDCIKPILTPVQKDKYISYLENK